jgi:drug/metabolite transporter (DMT)-like permease
VFYCGAGLSTILSNTQVFSSAVLSYFVFSEKLTLKFYLAAISAFVGVALLVGLGSADVEFTTRYILGVVFGIVSGLAYANYIIALKKGGHSPDLGAIITLMAWTSGFCAVILGVSAGIEGTPMMPPDARSWVLLLAMGLVAQTFGWLSISTALPHLDASRAGLALLLQPTLATVWGVLMFGEVLTVVQALGAAITLAAIYFGSVHE